MNRDQFSIIRIGWSKENHTYNAVVRIGRPNQGGFSSNSMTIEVNFPGDVQETFSSIQERALSEAFKFLNWANSQTD